MLDMYYKKNYCLKLGLTKYKTIIARGKPVPTGRKNQFVYIYIYISKLIIQSLYIFDMISGR